MPEYTTKTHRDSPFLFQMRVPASLSPAFGRKTIRLSLRTYEPTKAKNMARRMAVLCQETFRHCEELPMTPEMSVVLQQARERLYDGLRRLMDQAEVDQVTKQGMYGLGTLQEVKEVLEERFNTDKQTLAQSDFKVDDANRHLIEDMFQKLNVTFDSEEERHTLSLLLQHERTKYTQQLLKILLHRLEGDFHYEKDVVAKLNPHGPLNSATQSKPMQPASPPPPRHVLSDVIQQYRDQYFPSISERSRKEYQNHTELLLEFLGHDFDVATFGHDTARTLIANLARLPRNRKKIASLKNMTLVEQLEDTTQEKITPRTLENIVINWKTFFNWCINQGFIQNNYLMGKTKGMTPGKSAQSVHEPFTRTDLLTLFPTSESEASYTHAWQYWLPRLALATGARVNELAQLEVNDVRLDGDIVYISIAGGNGKRVKTAAAVRNVPLHPWILQLGFLNYVAQLRASNETRLWPTLKYRNESWGHNVTQWFGPLLQRKNIAPLSPKKKKSFHSFRTRMATMLKFNGIPDRIAHELLGHNDKDMSYAYYASGYTPRQLHEHLSKLDLFQELK